ncbi:MAG: hypothetical protein CMC96_01565 [Flavobacteriales bacterium]|nr:hypothetical protein [Flavobacteriales bacterium]
MENFLFIAYQFPPLNVGGSARPGRFAKSIKSFGLNPIIVTLDPNDYDKVYPNSKSDSNILADFKGELDYIKVPSKSLIKDSENKLKKFFKIFFNVYGNNEKSYWESNYYSKVNKYLKNNKVSAVVVTAPPFGVLPLAMKTAKEFHLPLIIDMRDPWTTWNLTPYSSYLNFIRTKRKERIIFECASKIIATSQVTLEDFKSLHPSVDSNKFEYIPNGFEGEISYKKLITQPNEKITIGYVGSFYYSPHNRDMIFKKWWKKKGHRKLQYVYRKEDWLYRSPYFLFKTLNRLFLKYPELKEKVELKFAGRKEAWFEKMVEEFELKSIVNHYGWLSHNDSLKLQKSCDYLLITSAKVIDGKDYSIAGKTFEYFKIQKPILAFVTDGAQKELLKESGLAYFVNVDSIEEGVEQLKAIFYESFAFEPNQAFINSFKITNLSRIFASIIKKVIKETR